MRSYNKDKSGIKNSKFFVLEFFFIYYFLNSIYLKKKNVPIGLKDFHDVL